MIYYLFIIYLLLFLSDLFLISGNNRLQILSGDDGRVINVIDETH